MKKSYNILSAFIISLMGVGLMSVNNANIKSDDHLIVRDVLRANASDNSGAIVNEVNEAPAQGNKVSAVKAQVSDVNDDKISIRFVAGIDTYTYDYAAFNITLKDSDKNAVATKVNTYEVTSAYHSVVAGEATKTATEVFGEGYNYLIAYTITNVPRDYWDYYYDVTASIGNDAEHVTTSAVSELKNIVRISGVTLDGQMDDPIWTDTVKSNSFRHALDNNSTYMDLYMAKNVNGIYLFSDYYTKVDYSSNTNWWEGNNFEFRFNSPEKVLINKGENEENKHQFWISRYNNAAASNMTAHFVSDPIFNEGTGYYNIKFEAFISNEKAGIDEDTKVGMTVGFNPGGAAWKACQDWAPARFEATCKITKDGLSYFYPESEHCSEGHEYGNWEAFTNTLCHANGSKRRICKWCNHTETNGTGQHAEGAVYENGRWSCCGNMIENPVYTECTSGWNSVVHKYTFDGNSAWSFRANLRAVRTGTEFGQSMVAEVFSPGWSSGGWTYRTDWWGWGPWNGTKDGPAENSQYYDVTGTGLWVDYLAASNDMEIEMNVSWDPATSTITVVMTYVSLSRPNYPVVPGITYTCKNIAFRGDMTIAFGADLAKITTYGAYATSGILR